MFGSERNFQLLRWKIGKLIIGVPETFSLACWDRSELELILRLSCTVFLLGNYDIPSAKEPAIKNGRARTKKRFTIKFMVKCSVACNFVMR